jgi:hypothetical protein
MKLKTCAVVPYGRALALMVLGRAASGALGER